MVSEINARVSREVFLFRDRLIEHIDVKMRGNVPQMIDYDDQVEAANEQISDLEDYIEAKTEELADRLSTAVEGLVSEEAEKVVRESTDLYTREAVNAIIRSGQGEV